MDVGQGLDAHWLGVVSEVGRRLRWTHVGLDESWVGHKFGWIGWHRDAGDGYNFGLFLVLVSDCFGFILRR